MQIIYTNKSKKDVNILTEFLRRKLLRVDSQRKREYIMKRNEEASSKNRMSGADR